MEGIIEYYQGLLVEAESPGDLLAKMFCEVHGVSNCVPTIITFKKLVKLYGRTRVFMAIVETTSIPDFNPATPYGIIDYICKNRLFKQIDTVTQSIDLSDVRKRMTRRPIKTFDNPFEGV